MQPPRSLFGGPLSTRAACIDRDALAKKAAELEEQRQHQLAKQQRQKIKEAGGAKQYASAVAKQQQAKQAESRQKESRKRLYDDLDVFDGLNTDAPAPKPKPKPKAATPPPGASSAAAGHAKSALHGAARGSLSPAPAAAAAAGPSGRTPQQHQQQQPGQGRPLAGPSHSGPAAAARPGAPPQRATPPLAGAPPQRPRPPGGLSSSGSGAQGRAPLRPPGQQRRPGDPRGQQRGPPPSRPGLPSAYRPPHSDEEDDDDGFIVDDDEEDEPEWRRELKSVTGYDARRFRERDAMDDRSMEASWRDIIAEEKRSARMGRLEDAKEEEEEARRKAEKAKRLRAS